MSEQFSEKSETMTEDETQKEYDTISPKRAKSHFGTYSLTQHKQTNKKTPKEKYYCVCTQERNKHPQSSPVLQPASASTVHEMYYTGIHYSAGRKKI